LNDPVAVNKAMLKLNFSKTEPTEEPEVKQNYSLKKGKGQDMPIVYKGILGY
jgi:hypothetical protein